MTDKLPPAAVAELRKLTPEQVVTLLGEILEPSIHSPFDLDDDLMDAMLSTSQQYHMMYENIAAAARGEPEWDAKEQAECDAAEFRMACRDEQRFEDGGLAA